MKPHLKIICIALVIVNSFCFAQNDEKLVTNKLQKVLAKRYPKVPAENRKFIYNAVDLNNDGKQEYLVGLIGSEFCGNAGCNMLVINNAYNIISSVTIVQYPVYVGSAAGKEVSKGYCNLYLSTGDKGLVKMEWNGKSYPSNPSLQPTEPSSTIEGKQKLLNAADQPTFTF